MNKTHKGRRILMKLVRRHDTSTCYTWLMKILFIIFSGISYNSIQFLRCVLKNGSASPVLSNGNGISCQGSMGLTIYQFSLKASF